MVKHELLATMLLLGCGGAPPPVVPPPHQVPVTAEAPMIAAFRAHVARRLGVPPEGLDDVTPRIQGKHDRGAARAIMMSTSDARRLEVRGWVTADGTVITPKHNLGVLFAEAGVWTQPPGTRLSNLAATLADDLVWSYGGVGSVESSEGFPSPTLTLADGSGTLVFYSLTQSSDPDPEAYPSDGGGGGGAGSLTFEDTVTLTADHKATLTRKWFDAGARR